MVLRSSGGFRLQHFPTAMSYNNIISDLHFQWCSWHCAADKFVVRLSEACHTGPLMSLRCAAVSLLRTSSYSLWVSTSSLSSSSSSTKSGSTEHKIWSAVAWNATLPISVETTQTVLKYRAQNTEHCSMKCNITDQCWDHTNGIKIQSTTAWTRILHRLLKVHFILNMEFATVWKLCKLCKLMGNTSDLFSVTLSCFGSVILPTVTLWR